MEVQEANPTQLMAGVIWGLRGVAGAGGNTGGAGSTPTNPLGLVAHMWRLGRLWLDAQEVGIMRPPLHWAVERDDDN